MCIIPPESAASAFCTNHHGSPTLETKNDNLKALNRPATFGMMEHNQEVHYFQAELQSPTDDKRSWLA